MVPSFRMAGRTGPAPPSRFIYIPGFVAPVGNTVVCELTRISIRSNGPTLDLNIKIIAVGPGDSLATPNFSSSLQDTSYRVRDNIIAPVTANISSKQFSGAVGTFANDVSFVAVQFAPADPNDLTAGLDLVASNAGAADLVGDLSIRYTITPGYP